MLEKKTWEDFRDSGLLWFVNSTLHLFGWAIVLDMEKGKVVKVYPARVKFRGFNESDNTEGYIKVTEYLNNNSKELLAEAKD